MKLAEIQNFYQIEPNLATAGQPQRGQFAAVAAAGYQAVINLALVDSPDAVSGEGDLVASLGMEYIHIPVVWDAPARADLVQFFERMDSLQGQKVFVHCARNMRVSAFVFLYRVLKRSQPPDPAWADVLRIWQPNETWMAFIEDSLAERG